MARSGAFYRAGKPIHRTWQDFFAGRRLCWEPSPVSRKFFPPATCRADIWRSTPAAVAAMEGLFTSRRARRSCSWASPTKSTRRIDNPIAVNDVLSFLIYGTTKAEVEGLDDFPRDQWPSRCHCCSTAITSWRDWARISYSSWWSAAFLLMAWQVVSGSLGIVGTDAQLSLSLHCEHRRMDDGRNRTAALGSLRIDSHFRRLFQICSALATAFLPCWDFMGLYSVLHSLYRACISHH